MRENNIVCGARLDYLLKKAFVDPFADVGSAAASAAGNIGNAAAGLGRTMGQQSKETSDGLTEAYQKGGGTGLLAYIVGLLALPLLFLALFYWQLALGAVAIIAVALSLNVVRTRGLRRLLSIVGGIVVLVVAIAAAGALLWFGGKLALSILLD